MQRYELNDGASAKFWEAGVKGSTLTVRFGRIGTAGQSKDKVLGSAEAAVKEWAKLIKEKIGKGYALAGAVTVPVPATPSPTPPEAVVDAGPQEVVAAVDHGPDRTAAPRPDGGRGKLFSAAALPTRTRPGPPLDPARDWAEFRRLLLELLPVVTAEQDAATTLLRTDDRSPFNSEWIKCFCLAHPGMASRLREVKDKDGGPTFKDRVPALLAEAAEQVRTADAWVRTRLARPPAPVGPEDARLWATHLLSICPDMGQRYYGEGLGDHRAAARTCFTHFARWLAASSGAAAVVGTFGRLRPTPMGLYNALPISVWDVPTTLGLRAAVVGLPEGEYEAAVKACNDLNDADDDVELAMFLVFVLADDRPGSRQPMRAGPALEACAGPERSYGTSRTLIPLIADLPPSAAAPWRARKDTAFLMAGCDVTVAEAAATLVAAAQAAGEPAAPSLTWFLRDLTGADRTVAATALLETQEEGALASLLPFMNIRPVRDAVDAAERAYPAWMFGQVLAAVVERDGVVLAGRVLAAVERHGLDTARAWAAEAGRKEAACLERAMARREVALAPPDTWPPFLRDPPWRRKRAAREEVVLALAPVPTSLAHGFTVGARVPHDGSRWEEPAVLESLGDLSAFIRRTEENLSIYFSGRKVSVEQCPPLDAPGEIALSWLRERLSEFLAYGAYIYDDYKKLLYGVAWQPEPLALMLWDLVSARSSLVINRPEVFGTMLARFGVRCLPALIGMVEADLPAMLPRVMLVETPELASLAAQALLKLKHVRPAAAEWLHRYPHAAAMRLLPDLLGAAGPARDAAERALRLVAADSGNGRATLDAVVARYAAQDPRVTQAVAQLLPMDPLERVPSKPPKVPAWVQTQALSRPVLRNGGALPDPAVSAVVEMALFSSTLVPYAGIEALRDACTPESLDAFAFDLLQAWSGAGALPNGEWALHAAAALGGDRCARDLTRLVRAWAAKGWRPRALAGIDALATLGSDVALINLKAIADKNPSDVIRGHAATRIAEAGEARGLSPDELADRLTPDLGLDERGGLDLDFGPRRFRVGFDEFLQPWVRDGAGQRLRILPRPGKADDATLAAAAGKRWAGLKKDAEAVAKLQVSRLETMLSTSCRLPPGTFWRFFATHPLLRHLAGRLVWGVFDGADPRGMPSLTFRIAEDLGLTDADDAPVALDLSDGVPGRVGLVHPLHLPPHALAQWAALFGEYEIAQPFAQLARETYALTDAEAAAAHTDRFKDAVVAGRRLRGLRSQGWPLDAGGESACQLVRQLALPDGMAAYATLDFSPGLWMSRGGDADEPQTLGTLSLRTSGGVGDAPLLGTLDRVTASELLRAPSLLAALGDA